MIKNICNYSAIILLSLVVMASAVSAHPHDGPTRVEGKSTNFYNKFLTINTPQSYSVSVKEGEQTSIKIHSNEGVAVKLYLPNGEIREYKNEKYFNLEFRAAGEYVIELNSPVVSQYTLKASTK